MLIINLDIYFEINFTLNLKAREMEQQIRTRQVEKKYVCRVEGQFPT